MMSIGPPLLPLLDEPQAAAPRPSARAATTASPSRTKGGLICLPSARPKGPPTGFERVAIKEFLPFSIRLVYKRPGQASRLGCVCIDRAGSDDAVGRLRPIEGGQHVVRHEDRHRIAGAG